MRTVFSRALAILAVAGLLAAAPALPARTLQMIPDASRLVVTFRQMSVPVEAEFKEFTVEGRFDPDQPAEARAEVTIDTASFDLGPGADDYNAEVRAPVWFDSAAHPQARLVLSNVRAQGGERYVADGELTLKGTTRPVSVPMTLSREGGQWTFDGELTISRLEFDIGAGEWRDTSIVADEVGVRFSIRTR